MKLRTLFFVAGLLWPASAFSQASHTTFRTGNELYESCISKTNSSQTNSAQNIFCLAYVAGIFDALESLRMTCRPNEVTMGQAQDMIANYLRDHPEARHVAAADIVGSVLLKTFPCK